MPLSEEVKKLAKQKIKEIKTNPERVDKSYFDIMNFNGAKNSITDVNNVEQMAQTLAYAYLVREKIAAKDNRAMEFKDEFRQEIRKLGIGAKEFEEFCGTNKVLDNYTKTKVANMVTSKGDLSLEGIKVNNRIDKLVNEYQQFVNQGNNSQAEEKGMEIIANAYMAKKSVDLRYSPAVNQLNERFKNEILPSILNVNKEHIDKMLSEIGDTINKTDLEDNYYVADPEDDVQQELFKFEANELEDNNIEINEQVNNIENEKVESFNVKDMVEYALSNRKLFEQATSEELYNVIKTNVNNYKGLKAGEVNDEDDLEMDEDNYEEDIDIHVGQKLPFDNQKENNLLNGYFNKQFANSLLALNILNNRGDDLEAEVFASKALRMIQGTFDLKEKDVNDFDTAIQNELIKEIEYDSMVENTKRITSDYAKNKNKMNVSKYAANLIKKNDTDKINYLNPEREIRRQYASGTSTIRSDLEKRDVAHNVERNDYLGLYSMVRKHNESRTGWSRFFHPFQNKKEKNLISDLEGRLDRLGINKESLDAIYNKMNEQYNVSAEGISKKVLTNEEKGQLQNDREKIPGLASDTSLEPSKSIAKEFETQEKEINIEPVSNKE